LKADGAALPTDEIILSQMFKSAGYVTGHIGKWHLGYSPATMPNARGFDHSFGHMGGCIDNYSHFMYWEGPNAHDLWENGKEIWREGQHIGDLTVAECNQFIEAHRSEPFFVYWALSQPHYPMQGSAKWRDYYAHLPTPRSMYAASVSMLDEMIGKVMAQVKNLGLAEQTIVMFQSDHGHSTEERNHFGGGSAGPYRGCKGSMFEGGIRVPAMISWPGHLPAGQVRGQWVTGCDWLPTVAELAQLPLPPRRIDGKSMLPILQSTDAPTRHETFHWQLGDQWACRHGEWKLISNPRGGSNLAPIGPGDALFLSNLEHDLGERTNLADRHPDIVARLSALHERWTRDVTDRS
jgi:arylsulfatase A-like enzyme